MNDRLREAAQAVIVLEDIKVKYSRAVPTSPRHPQWKQYLSDVQDFPARYESAWNALRAALAQPEPEPALARFNTCKGNEQESPIERLRFFCSLAMNGQDWLDVEPFFDALTQPEPFQPYNEDSACTEDRVAWMLCQIIDDDAPMRWTRYRFAAERIANNAELMANLLTLRDRKKNG